MDFKASNRQATLSPHDTRLPHVVPGDRTPCVWMGAGVLTWWICDRDLECSECPLDAALRRTSCESLSSATFATTDSPRTRVEVVEREIEALDTRARYARTHVWVRREARQAVRLGLDAFAAWVIGHVRCVVLVPPGSRVARGEPCAWLDQPGGTLTIRSPISGDVIATNTTLSQRGDTELRDVFGSDWLLVLRPCRLRIESHQLAGANEFARRVAENVRVWRRVLRKAMQAGSTCTRSSLPDGGVAVADLDALLGPQRHTRIAAGFLRGSRKECSPCSPLRIRRSPIQTSQGSPTNTGARNARPRSCEPRFDAAPVRLPEYLVACGPTGATSRSTAARQTDSTNWTCERTMDRSDKMGARALDEEILRSVQSGEPDAFDRFVKRFGNRIYGFGMRVCNQTEDAEDVYQDTLVAVFRTLESLREPQALTTWLYRIVANACRSKRRKGSFAGNREIPLDDLLPQGEPILGGPVMPDAGGPVDDVYHRELAEALEKSVRNLPPDYRVVWLMRDAEGLSTQETADALDISVPNVKMRLHRARLQLRKALAHLHPRGANA